MQTGFIGVGNIGGPMAHRVAAMSDLMVCDLDPKCLASFAGKAQFGANPAVAGRHAAIVSICVKDDAALRSVVLGDKGLFSGMGADSIVLVHSTVSVATVRELADIAREHGIHVLDAAVTGGPAVAASGNLCTMIGGDEALVERARPVLEAFSSKVIHAGCLGAGITLKICNNLVSWIEVAAAFESFQLAEALGLNSVALREVMLENGNLSPIMRMFVDERADRRAGKTVATAPEHARLLAEKDLDLAVALGSDAGVDVRVGAYVRTLIADAFCGA